MNANTSERYANAPGVEAPEDLEIRLGISTCLLGQRVRYDSGHKRNAFLVDTLGPYVTWYPVCPEVEIGLPTPRPAMRLSRAPEGPDAPPRLVVTKTGEDLTERMQTWATSRLQDLAQAQLDGYVLKKDSPSCGLFRVRVYDQNGMPSKTGAGLWASAVRERYGLLPVEDEGRLNDQTLRENFVLRVYTMARWRSLLANDATPAGLVRFHTAHKLVLLARSPAAYRELGRLVAQAGTLPWDELAARYLSGLMEGLAQRAKRGRHVNTIEHLMGFLKNRLSSDEKMEMTGVLASYRKGHVPLAVPLTLLGHHLRHHKPNAWAEDQVYLRPYPEALMLRIHV